MKYLLLLTSLFTLNYLPAQSNIDSNKYAHQIRLIDSLRSFVRTDLKLVIPDKFYTKWETLEDSMYTYLYVSDTARIGPVTPEQKIVWYFEHEDSAIAKCNWFKAMGYHTLVYKTAGMSNANLNAKLLSYPDEAIAFIIFHEAVHNHMQNYELKNSVDHLYEEALCDAVANYACERFSEKTGRLSLKAVLQQKKIFEDIYQLINSKRLLVEGATAEARGKLFKFCTDSIKQCTANANQFQKDRMNYEVNNAYFMRQGPYSTYYFRIRSLFAPEFEISRVIKNIRALTANEPDYYLYNFAEDPILDQAPNNTTIDLPKTPSLLSPWSPK